MSNTQIRAALNGCNGPVSLKGKQIYNLWSGGESHDDPLVSEFDILGQPLDKSHWIKNNITDEQYTMDIMWLLADWQPYENGWLVTTDKDSGEYRNNHLFYYKCQIGALSYQRPKELDYLTKHIVAWS